jgi:hypothetical protein
LSCHQEVAIEWAISLDIIQVIRFFLSTWLR